MLLLLLACAPTPAPDDSAPPAALEVQIGTGATAWEPLEALDPLTMVHGPQGGWHLLGSVWVHNWDGEAEVHFTVTTEEGVRVADNLYRVFLYLDGQGGGQFPGMYAYLSVAELAQGEADTPPELLAGQPLTLHMDVGAPGGASGSHTLVVTAALDPADQ